jgi:hypothetical protein
MSIVDLAMASEDGEKAEETAYGFDQKHQFLDFSHRGKLFVHVDACCANSSNGIQNI